MCQRMFLLLQQYWWSFLDVSKSFSHLKYVFHALIFLFFFSSENFSKRFLTFLILYPFFFPRNVHLGLPVCIWYSKLWNFFIFMILIQHIHFTFIFFACCGRVRIQWILWWMWSGRNLLRFFFGIFFWNLCS